MSSKTPFPPELNKALQEKTAEERERLQQVCLRSLIVAELVFRLRQPVPGDGHVVRMERERHFVLRERLFGAIRVE